MKKIQIIFIMLLLPVLAMAQHTGGNGHGDYSMSYIDPVVVTATEGTAGPTAYQTLKAAFDAINLGTHKGIITVKINASTTETDGAVLNASGSGTTPNISGYTAVTVYPTVTGLTISGAIAGPLVDLNGADKVTIDGRVNQLGVKDLTIVNTYATVNNLLAISAIRFINSAENNKVKYCTIKASALSTMSGIILFSTATAGNGNSGNKVDNCDLTQDSNRPYRVFYSLGSDGFENKNDTVSNCNIYNFFKSNSTSNGIFISSFSTDWVITGNNLYESTPVVPGGPWAYYFIRVDNTSGNNFTISNNFIGGTAADHTGTWTVNAAFTHYVKIIWMRVGATTASSVQNNTIQGISYRSGSTEPFYGISIDEGKVNIGTETGNVIGSASSPITITGTNLAANTTSMGIYIGTTQSVSVENNTLSAIILDSPAPYAHNFYGIYNSFSGTSTTIRDNVIGSASAANSIISMSASTGNAQLVYGIVSLGQVTTTIDSNTIANITNGTTNSNTSTAGRIIGIVSNVSLAANSVTNNKVYNLTIANANNSSTDMSVVGVSVAGNGYNQTVTGNTIHDLSNTFTSFTGSVVGLYLPLPTSVANAIAQNFIYNLFVPSSSGANVYGIKINSGSSTYANNIISLGGSTATKFYGIYVNDPGVDGHNTNLFYNTVYLSGISNTQPSYALYSAFGAVSTSTRDFRNNIFYNARTIGVSQAPGNSGVTHYAAYFAATSGPLTCDYNDYYVSTVANSGGMLGYFGGDKTVLPIVTGLTGNDAHSLAVDPVFATPGTTAASYLPTEATLVGIISTGITTDYGDTITRSTTYPSMGAWESPTPAVPVATAATNVSFISFTANWNAANYASKYYIDVATDASFTSMVSGWNNKDVGKVTTYAVNTGLSLNTAYHYRVRAYNASGGSSASSNIISPTTLDASFSSGVNYYSTWNDVLAGVTSGTVTQLKKYTATSGASITNDFTLDLNGFTFDGSQDFTIGNSKTFSLKGTGTSIFDNKISFGDNTSTLELVGEISSTFFGVNFTTTSSTNFGKLAFGDETTGTSFTMQNGDSRFAFVSKFIVNNAAILTLSLSSKSAPAGFEIADGGIVKLSETGSYMNTFTSTTNNSTSTALLQTGSSSAITATLTGDLSGYYGRVTFYDGSTLNMSPSYAFTIPSRFEIGGSSATATQTLAITSVTNLSNGDISNLTNPIVLNNYGVLDLTGLTGDLTLTNGGIAINNVDGIPHDGLIKFKLDYKIIIPLGTIAAPSGTIDVTKNFLFDMDNRTATFGQTEAFTVASVISQPSFTGTPVPVNSTNWSGFSVTASATSGKNPTQEWQIKLNATYYTPIIHVDADKTDDTGNGLTWATAKKTLQAALAWSVVPGYQIWVKEGIYNPTSAYDMTNTSRFYHFRMKEGVKIYGGFAGTETDTIQRVNYGLGEINETILSGDLSGDDNYAISPWTGVSENCYHIFYHPSGLGLTSISKLDGFIIKAANADGPDDAVKDGAAMYNDNNSPSISYCTFIYNTSYRYGGAVYNVNNSNVRFSYCNFISNNAVTSDGGAINLYTIGFTTIDNCIFDGNEALKYGMAGGAIYHSTLRGRLTITNSVFKNNEAYGGGALRLRSVASLTNCLIYENTSTTNGGAGIRIGGTVTLTNVTVANNSATLGKGGGILLTQSGSVQIINSIIWGNTAPLGKQIYYDGDVASTVDHTCFANGTNDIAGTNIPTATFSTNGDPLFVRPSENDYRITGISSAVDLGLDEANSLLTDIRGTGYPRKLLKTNAATTGTIDMGAYEYKNGFDPAAPYPLLTTTAITGITINSASSGGETINDMSETITAKGVVWDIATEPTTALTTKTTETITPGSEDADFTSSITGLDINTKYYVRAYATNVLGTGYGDEKDFWTLAETPSAPTVNYPTTTTLDVAINANGNPAITTYAILDTVTGKFVQTNGALGITAAWQTEALWEVNAANTAKTVTGLAVNSLHTFKVKAKNGSDTETDYSGLTSLYTLAAVPDVPTINVPDTTSLNVAINVNGNSDTTGFAIYERKGNKYVQANGTLGNLAVWQTQVLWETDAINTAKKVTGLSPDQEYTFQVKARNGDDVETAFSGADSLYTHANVPDAPIVINPTATSLDVAVRPNGNPATTVFAIQDSSLVSQYVKADGTRGATEVWQTAAVWDTITVTGLSTGVTYYFRVKAKNGNDVETAFGLTTGQNTCSNPTDGGEIGSNETIYTGSSPDTLVNISLASNFGGTLEYQWQQATLADSTDFDDITDADAIFYVPGNLTSTTWFRRLARVACKTDWTGSAASNVVKITVQHFPEVVITAPADGSKVYTNPITISGTASDSDGNLSYVQVKLNSGTWQTTTGTDTWTIDLNLVAGKNTIFARACDATVLYSDTASINVLLSIQIINIPQGWSAISSYLTPQNPALPVMMDEITDNNNLVIMLSENGVYWPSQNYNTIGNWNVEKGYKVKMNNAQEFTVRGDTLTSRSLSLSQGYHIIPVLSNVGCPITSVFADPLNDIFFMFDVKTNALYWPQGEIFSLTTLEPGKGYVASLNKAVTLTYPAYSGLKNGIITDNTELEMNGPWALVRTGDVHFISIKNEAVKKLENASFIGAFDSFGNCIGYAEVDGRGENYLLSVYGNDAFTDGKDGAEEAEPISFRSYNSATNTETELIAEYNASFPNADGLYVSGGQSAIISFKESSTGIGEAGIAGNVQIYPNPAKDVINIATKGFRTLQGFGTLMTAEGKLVKTFAITGNQTQLDVQELKPGIYILKIETAENVVVKRVVIQ